MAIFYNKQQNPTLYPAFFHLNSAVPEIEMPNIFVLEGHYLDYR